MTQKIKLAIMALLGFSTACSTVKSNSGSQPKDKPQSEQQQPHIVVMYGVRPPKGRVVKSLDSTQVVAPQPKEVSAPSSEKE